MIREKLLNYRLKLKDKTIASQNGHIKQLETQVEARELVLNNLLNAVCYLGKKLDRAEGVDV